MQKFKKTYAIYHLAEKHTTFRLGKTAVKVSFTGGIVTKKGVTPATFTTSDPIVQMAIEQSDDYKKGFIRLLSKYPANGEVKVGKNPLRKTPEAGSVSTEEKQIAENSPVTSDETVETADEEQGEEYEKIVNTDTSEVPEDEVETTESENHLEIIDASCKDVAKQYLEEHFGENPVKLRTRDDIQKCAVKYGLQFNFV